MGFSYAFLVIASITLITVIRGQAVPVPVNCYSCSSPASANLMYAPYLPINYNMPWISPDCSNNPETGAVAVAYSCPNKCYSVSSYNLTIRGCSDGLITPNGWNSIYPNLTATTAQNGCYVTTQGNVIGNGLPSLVYLCFCNTPLCNNVHEGMAKTLAQQYMAYAYKKDALTKRASLLLVCVTIVIVFLELV